MNLNNNNNNGCKATTSMDVRNLSDIINHVFLPPKLPQEDDSNAELDLALLHECEAALRSLQAHFPSDQQWRWSACIKMLNKIPEVRDASGDMISRNVEASLRSLTDGDILAFHIRSQNAGLVVRKLPEHVSFESFELSPTTEYVMKTKGRLRRCFPGPVVAISHDRLGNASFLEELSQLLTKLDFDTPKEAWQAVSKANSEAIEARDSVHPKFVTEMLTGILRGIGRPLDVVRIHKRTRDDVVWKDAGKPWRRSPFWLLLRVALQTSLLTDESGLHIWYKSFMIFLMGHILEHALEASLESDLLFVMAAKISQRIRKLGIAYEQPWIEYVQRVMESTQQELARRWSILEENPDPFGTQSASLSELSFFHDTALSLPTLRPYLLTIAGRMEMPSDCRTFVTDLHKRIKQSSSVFPELNLLRMAAPRDARLCLADLELWVQDFLSTWLATNLDCQHSCTLIADFIEIYNKVATRTYANNPEDISLMLLTSMDLWVALDKCATHHHSILAKYDPGFSPSLFDPLLLPKRSQMERLVSVEQYLEERRRQASPGFPSIFQDVNTAKSFSVQYFEQSHEHQALRRRIEAAAEIKRNQKRAELVQKCQRYQQLMEESNSLTCEVSIHWKKGRERSSHSTSCRKCQLKSIATNLQITVDEWPLPQGQLEVKSAVFELDVPFSIVKWRDTTYSLLVDTFSPPILSGTHEAGQRYRMSDFSGLVEYFNSKNARLDLRSTSKPFVISHYGTKLVSQATQENICVNNGLHYSMYDSKSEKWTKSLLGRCDIQRICTMQLPQGPYQKLQFSLNGTTHTSNEVLAIQSDCPKSLNLHEFYAFATLRSGDRLQWRNIARELVPRNLNFNNEETYMLVVQAAWQVGRCGNGSPYRESHIDLEEEEFGISLLSVLEESLDTIERNWHWATAIRMFVALATRLLSMTSWDTVRKGCFLFLRRARKVTLQWTRDVSRLLNDSQDAKELKTLNLKVLEIALTCHGTFNVDKCYLSELLNLDDDVAVVTECSIIVHDHCPAETMNVPQSVQTLLQRYQRLSHLLEPILRSKILADRGGIDNTLRHLWAGYRPGSRWSALETPCQRWLVTGTSREGGYSSMTVHYDILNGSLLVNGAPLARLPLRYETHSTYCRVFGQKVLDVVPSRMRGMDFATRNQIHGQQIHFAMYGSELVIRTEKDNRVCEVLPLRALRGDFPEAFVNDYVHWFDTSTGWIEWRPLKNAWVSSPDNWQMRADGQEIFTLSYGAKALIDVHSQTAKSISGILSPLEHATHIYVVLDRGTGGLEVHLPRLKLDFFVEDQRNSLQSKQFRGMVVDKEQSFGAFTGLVNKLVLREVKGKSRAVIVPYGNVIFSPEGHHVRVTIDTAAAIDVRYHSYNIDAQLGRLVDNSSLQSRLFRLYLHATTSHCLIDQLTGRTGTEEALYGLKSAATRSFMELQPIDIELLELLARLTPRRLFYPEHLRVMHQVDWHNLSPLSQHCDFYKQVVSILDHAKSLQVFREEPVQLLMSDTRGHQFLMERSSIRDSSFQVHGFGAEIFTADHDIIYASRDQVSDKAREFRTCCTAKLVDEWSVNLTTCTSLLFEIMSWRKAISGSDRDLTLGFSFEWLDTPANFLPDYWCTLHKTLARSEVERDKYKIMVFLSTLSYSTYMKQEIVQTLLALATIPGLRNLQPPSFTLFDLAKGCGPERQKLIGLTKTCMRPFHECPEYHLPMLPDEKFQAADERRQDQHQIAKEQRIEIFVDGLLAQWPTANVSAPTDANHSTYILVDQAVERASKCFQSWYWNAQFEKYIRQIQHVLENVSSASQNLREYSVSLPIDRYLSKRRYLNFSDLTGNPAPCLPPAGQGEFDHWIIRESKGNAVQSKLKDVLTHTTSRSFSGHERQYVADLLKSFDALREEASVKLNPPLELSTLLESNLTQAQDHMDLVYHMICSHLRTGVCNFAGNAQMQPRLSPTSILSHLASDKIGELPSWWKVSFVQYGLSIAALQRAERLLAAAESPAELLAELDNPGHREWDPMCFPEWLLLEIENNILVRQDQAQISREMMSPSSGLNSVMQLNMGLGKSSVIVPIVAAALADRTKLVRVLVLKPLAAQMFRLLANRLGGMLNRPIYYLPVSRSLRLDAHQAYRIRDLYKECMQMGGVLLVQPEHILSFELMGLERLLCGNVALGTIMVQTQDWLRVNSRDILDESDEILSVKFELIYTIGMQRAIEFSPDRWTIVETVLGIFSDAAYHVRENFPEGLEVISAQSGGFPRIRILQSIAGDELLDTVARKLCETGLPGLPVCFFPEMVRKALFRYITDPFLSATANQSVQEVTSSSESMRDGLLLLKGLFAGGILKFAFEQKRWRVNYGLDPSRTMLAVPYHAKDSPAARAEFSHPDATIVLTCLAYYYGGISDQQMRASFEELLRSDHAKEEYEKWVKDAPELPSAFREISGINLSNIAQCSREVFPPLRFAKSVIDFYLSTMVFPAEMKEFPDKLSSSGWDIALEKLHPTTGFSGTNDSKYILPLPISQCDLAPQLSTNAAVLNCLLGPENSIVEVDSATGVLDAEVLLKMALDLKPPVRVILDVGAQVLELQNEEFVQKWLSRVPESEAQAAIFFDSQNEILVLSRNGTKEPLLISPFAKQMDQCLVYLDECHTRGTDLKMPANYRAIVTLGPRLTKDRLVQACLRMRKLGKGQSVVFCCSMEVQRKIRECSGKMKGTIEVTDMLKWCIAETIAHTTKSIPLWATQGVRHQRRQGVCLTHESLSRDLVKTLLEPEAQSLQQRYGDESAHYEEAILLQNATDGPLTIREKQLDEIRAKCREFQVVSFNTATLQEEQERELSPEKEREYQIERPPASEPCKHNVHKDVRQLIAHGILDRSSDAFQPAFETLRKTTAFDHYESGAWPDDLLVTSDFAKTVQATDDQFLDSSLRPVHWIVSCKSQKAFQYVVLSPYEAQELLPSIRKLKAVTLHVYSPRLSFSVRTLEHLSFCAIPAVPESLPRPEIIRHINVFAGQLYIQDYEEYRLVCGFLGLCSEPPGDGMKVACDGFINPTDRANSENDVIRACSFTSSPVAFVKMIIALRRKGQSFAKSHFGKILNGELIGRNEFDSDQKK